jgi:hypothetical protein
MASSMCLKLGWALELPGTGRFLEGKLSYPKVSDRSLHDNEVHITVKSLLDARLMLAGAPHIHTLGSGSNFASCKRTWQAKGGRSLKSPHGETVSELASLRLFTYIKLPPQRSKRRKEQERSDTHFEPMRFVLYLKFKPSCYWTREFLAHEAN